jgi:hypothetical protein
MEAVSSLRSRPADTGESCHPPARLHFRQAIKEIDSLEKRCWDGLPERVMLAWYSVSRSISDSRNLTQLELGEPQPAPAFGRADHSREHQLEHGLFAEAVRDDLQAPSPADRASRPEAARLSSPGRILSSWDAPAGLRRQPAARFPSAQAGCIPTSFSRCRNGH